MRRYYSRGTGDPVALVFTLTVGLIGGLVYLMMFAIAHIASAIPGHHPTVGPARNRATSWPEAFATGLLTASLCALAFLVLPDALGLNSINLPGVIQGLLASPVQIV